MLLQQLVHERSDSDWQQRRIAKIAIADPEVRPTAVTLRTPTYIAKMSHKSSYIGNFPSLRLKYLNVQQFEGHSRRQYR